MTMTEQSSLSRFVSCLKNVRAVAFIDPEAALPKEELRWVSTKYRYRSIGVSAQLLKSLPDNAKAVFQKKPFITLSAPISEIETFTWLLSNFDSNVSCYVFDSMVMASCYVNPLLIFGRESYNVLEPFAAWELRSRSELPDVELKRNLRIIGYAILDFHEKVINQAYETLHGITQKLLESVEDLQNFEKFVENRRKLAKADGERRFWRLRKEGVLPERVVIAYLDVIPVIARALQEVVEIRNRATSAFHLISHIGKSSPDLAMALCMVPSFILEL